MTDEEAEIPEATPPADDVDVPLWWETAGPIRETVFAYLTDRLYSLQVREQMDGVKMLPGWRRELTVMTAMKKLYDWHEQRELERETSASQRRRRS